MTDDQRIEMLMYHYTPFVDFIVFANKRFLGISDPIKWKFFFNESPALTAIYDKTEKGVLVNVVSVDFAFAQGEPYQVEFFILHELRHWYQFSEMDKYKTDPTKCDNPVLAEQWLKETDNYVKPSVGEKNANYYAQDMEEDAYAFAYAVVSYKYGKGLPHLVPRAYENEAFFKRVDTLIEQFKNTI